MFFLPLHSMVIYHHPDGTLSLTTLSHQYHNSRSLYYVRLYYMLCNIVSYYNIIIYYYFIRVPQYSRVRSRCGCLSPRKIEISSGRHHNHHFWGLSGVKWLPPFELCSLGCSKTKYNTIRLYDILIKYLFSY